MSHHAQGRRTASHGGKDAKGGGFPGASSHAPSSSSSLSTHDHPTATVTATAGMRERGAGSPESHGWGGRVLSRARLLARHALASFAVLYQLLAPSPFGRRSISVVSLFGTSPSAATAIPRDAQTAQDGGGGFALTITRRLISASATASAAAAAPWPVRTTIDGIVRNEHLTAVIPPPLHATRSDGGEREGENGCGGGGGGGAFILSSSIDDAITAAHNRQRLLLVIVVCELQSASQRLLADVVGSSYVAAGAVADPSRESGLHRNVTAAAHAHAHAHHPLHAPREQGDENTEGGGSQHGGDGRQAAWGAAGSAPTPTAVSSFDTLHDQARALHALLFKDFVVFCVSTLDPATHALTRVHNAAPPLLACYACLGGAAGVTELASVEATPAAFPHLLEFVRGCSHRYGGPRLPELVAAISGTGFE